MTDRKLNIIIARACGWKSKEETNGEPWLWQRTRKDKTIESILEPPDYCNDLNAMHEAEKVLNSDDIFETYYLALYETTQSTRWPVCATARQRAEAFLRTLNKWEEAV
jgi:hypothetical protein